MATLRSTINRKAALAIWPLIGACLVAYFTYHAVQGHRGLIAYSHLRTEVRQAETVLESLQDERQHLEVRAQRLRPENLDPDLLEERARAVLNYSHPEDLMVLTPETDAKAPAGN